MNMNRTERNRIKTDRAWSKLYQRLEEDRLIPAKEDKNFVCLLCGNGAQWQQLCWQHWFMPECAIFQK